MLESQLSTLDEAIYLKQIDLDEVQKQKDRILAVFRQKPDLINEYNSLQEELEISSQNLVSLIAARENFQLEIAQSTIPWKIISPAIMDPIP